MQSDSLFRRISISREMWRIPCGLWSCFDLKNATERDMLKRRLGTAKRTKLISSMMTVASV
jgi:hypothetical protein